MPSITDILTGLSGAGGCSFDSATSQLYYVEFSGNLSKTNPLSPVHTVVGTGYSSPEDVELSADGLHVYITERTGDLLKVSLATPNRAAAKVVTSGMTAPQQLALDEAHDTAYVVEFAPSGHLYKVNLTSGTKTAIAVTLTNAVGLVITDDGQYAYVSEETSPSGRIRKIKLSDGSATVIATGLVTPFFLTFEDASETSLFVAERDPVNRITRVDLITNLTSVVVSGFSSRPGAVAPMSSSRMLVHGETTLSIVDFLPFVASGPLFMGFGFIPSTSVIQSAGPLQGLADTSTPPGYFYQVKDTPFGGSLPIMINYPAAVALGATFYRISVDGVVRLDTWSDEEWNGTAFVPVTISPTPVNGQPGFYPVRTAPFQFINPALGSLVDSTTLSNVVHSITVEFVKANPIGPGAPIVVATTTAVLFRVDNNPCKAVLNPPTVGVNVADACGILRYVNPTDTVTLPFTATQANNFADYSYQLIRGNNNPPAPIISGATSGQVSAGTNPGAFTGTVAGLMGPCVTGGMAAFAESLYVAARANSGWSRQGQYDQQALEAFVLAK